MWRRNKRKTEGMVKRFSGAVREDRWVQRDGGGAPGRARLVYLR